MSDAEQPQPASGWRPRTCDGLEQEAFEKWAAAQRYSMEVHPLHYLFLNERTSAARAGWRAAIEYCATMLDAPPAAAPSEAIEHRTDILALARECEVSSMALDRVTVDKDEYAEILCAASDLLNRLRAFIYDPPPPAAAPSEQPQPEPVGWMVYTQDGQSVYVTDNPSDIKPGQKALPLYTEPPPPGPLLAKSRWPKDAFKGEKE